MKTEENKYIKMAIDLATDNVKSGNGGPFGAVIVKNGKVVATGVNTVTTSHDPTAHAEVNAIRNACAKLEDFQLDGCEIYSSCEPCPMCLGAIYWSRADKLYFAATKSDASDAGFDDSFIYDEIALPITNRRLATTPINNIDKLQPFKAWKQLINKTEY
jgi:tRNA(Arg) A34 adenosine deaminase TadA